MVEFSHYFRLQVSILTLAGVSLIPRRNILYWVYSKCALLAASTYTVFELISMLEQRENFKVVSIIITFILANIFGNIKVFTLMFNRENVVSILTKLSTKVNDERNNNPKNLVLIEQAKLILKVLSFFYYIPIQAEIIYGLLRALWFRFSYEPDQWMMILPNKPVNRESPLFEIELIIQWLGVTYTTTSLLSADLLVIGILILIRVEFIFLQNEIQDMNDFIKAQPVDRPVEWNTLKSFIKRIVDNHNSIIAIADEAEEVYNKMLLPVFFGNSICLCFTYYTLATADSINFHQFENLAMSTNLAMQMGMFCFWGNKVSEESQKVADAFYGTSWFGTDCRFQKALVPLIERAQKPVVLTAGKIVELSLANYMFIMKASYSFFNVVYTMQK